MAILPFRCGNSNRADLQQIASSLLAQRGDAITTAVGSIIWVETQAWARAVYSIWAVNQKLAYQFDPNKMTDFLPRWESIMGLAALPTDTIQTRQQRIASRFNAINKMPTTQKVTDLMQASLGITFLGLINDPAPLAYAQFPGGAAITGGITNVVDGPWYSTVQELFIEVYHPAVMTNNQFYNTVNQVFPLLSPYLPAYDSFDWFWNSFRDDGYATADGYATGTISGTVGDNHIRGFGTAWNTPVNHADNTFDVVIGSILECFDDEGVWRRMVVSSVNSDSSITLTTQLVGNITRQPYVIEGFFLDCDNTQFPYPPIGCLNLDNAGINKV
jgi:hypothetical protein